MNSPLGDPVDPYIQRLKESRDKNAVLKFRLAAFRSSHPDVPVIALEGVEDKLIYFQWIRRIRPGLNYEPFPCKGKKQVLRFREMLGRDLGGLKNGVYFIVDRDFDDLAGFSPGPDLFMTDKYAVENYLVSEDVLRELMKGEYHCHARPEVREVIVAEFHRLYQDFAESTRDLNCRLFLAKQLGLELTSHVPQKINEIAVVELSRVSRHAAAPENIIRFARDPSTSDSDRLSADFGKLEPASRYRGKFALGFFERWLTLLADDYDSSSSVHFSGVDRSARVQRSEITLGNLASKSQFPLGLPEFVATVT